MVQPKVVGQDHDANAELFLPVITPLFSKSKIASILST